MICGCGNKKQFNHDDIDMNPIPVTNIDKIYRPYDEKLIF